MSDNYFDDSSDEEEVNDLFRLLNFNPYDYEKGKQKIDANAIIKEVQQNPHSVESRYSFLSTYHGPCFPLYQAIILKAPVNVIDALYFPTIQKEKWSSEPTALHIAAEFRAPLDIVKILLEKQPESVYEKTSDFGYTPLHKACMHDAPSEVVVLLLNAWPDSVREKTTGALRDTPLHLACFHGASLEVISLLLNIWPEASKEKTMAGFIPLNFACRTDAPLEVILLVLEKWLEVTEYRITDDMESVKLDASDDIKEILNCVSALFDEKVKTPSQNQIMPFFINIEWWNGVVLVLDNYPAVTQTIDLNTTVKADFLAMVSRRCRLKTMWEIICNEQDLFSEL